MHNPAYRLNCLPIAIAIFAAFSAWAQPGTTTVKGQVTDPSGATIPGASVALTNGKVTRQAKSDSTGNYTIPNLPPGAYNVRVDAKGFASYQTSGLQVANGTMNYDIPLVVATEASSVTVSTDTGAVSTDPSSNVGAIVLKADDLKMLSDDPDDLAADLQALAGPSAGPNGGQIYIDGFSGGQLPPKESIREVRINSNPFSAEYDRMGFGRIEIFTKPGTDKFRGQGFFNFGNKIFNTRNPFVTGQVPDYQQEMFGANLSGPITKKSSFFIDFNRRMIDENALIVATPLDANLNVTSLNTAVVTPLRRTEAHGRIDYALTPNNTLVVRYGWEQNSAGNQGIGGFTLPALATQVNSGEQQVQVTETSVIGTHMIDETRFQYMGTPSDTTGLSSGPTIAVAAAFTTGGSPVSSNFTHNNRYELQNNVSISHGVHQIRFGVRLRSASLETKSTSNYNGNFTFAGGAFPVLGANNQVQLDGNGNPVLSQLSSVDQYRQTQLLLNSGLTPAQVRGLGYGPNQFTINGGTPISSVSQYDAGLFAQDDWRALPNLTVSLGIRYETQNNIGDHGDIAPRIGIAWAPGSKKSSPPKTVIRAGFGIFYERFSENNTLDAIRLDGIRQQQFIIPNPDFYPNVPSIASLNASKFPQAIRQVFSGLVAPRMEQAAFGLERQLPKRISLSVNYAYTRGVHQLLSRNINAPLPGGGRPYGASAGNIYLYESSGIFKQNQLITSVQARVSPKFTMFGFYVLGKADSTSDGTGGFPSDQYNIATDFGRSSFDVRHRAFIGGSVTAPWALTLSPFITMSSAPPFNITAGRDINGDGIFNDRPAFATDLTRLSVVRTAFGNFDTNPIAGQTIIPRDYGDGHGNVSVNLRVSRSWGFGERKSAQADGPFGGGGGGGGMGEGGPRGGGGGGGGRGGPGGGGGGGGVRVPGGPGGMFGGAGGAGNKRFVLTASVNARNALNHVNLGAPVGDLSSRLFGQSTGISGGGFGGGGPGGGGGGAAGNRRVDFQLRLSF